MSVIIVGAGIGGLTTALSLHQIGVACRVFESVPSITPLGVGINVLPHAVRELTELNLADGLAVNAIETAELAYFSKRGQPIWSEPRGQAAGYDWPQFSIHRGELQQVLLDAARERLGVENVLPGHHAAAWQAVGDEVEVAFVDRDDQSTLGTQRGSLLIAADGIHSQIRASLYPDEPPPIWNGAVLWRGISEAPPFLTGRSMIMAGHEYQKFVCYPISRTAQEQGRAVLNWVAERKFDTSEPWRREDWNREGALPDFLPQFEDWRFPWLDVPGLITHAEHVFEYPMVDRDPLSRWTHGRVTLLGDAAHPMYPIGSNGASQAILDARHLAAAIQQHGATEAALGEYEQKRRPPTSKIVLANRGNGPEQVMQLVEECAPQGYRDIEDVLSRQELEDIAKNYKSIAGFDREQLNAQAPIVLV